MQRRVCRLWCLAALDMHSRKRAVGKQMFAVIVVDSGHGCRHRHCHHHRYQHQVAVSILVVIIAIRATPLLVVPLIFWRSCLLFGAALFSFSVAPCTSCVAPFTFFGWSGLVLYVAVFTVAWSCLLFSGHVYLFVWSCLAFLCLMALFYFFVWSGLLCAWSCLLFGWPCLVSLWSCLVLCWSCLCFRGPV